MRAFMPSGESEYLMRLRCPDGKEPEVERQGSYGPGPHGNILDGYKVSCAGRESTIFIDMYHRSYREQEAVPGFTVLQDLPAKVAVGCPPAVPGHDPGTYVFRSLEVMLSPKPEVDLRAPVKAGSKGRGYGRFTIDTRGTVVSDSIRILYVSDESFHGPTIDRIAALKFQPAQHHEGCAVPFAAELGIDFE